MDAIKLHGKLIDEELFTQEELRLVTQINGYSIKTFNDCIFVRYGFKNWAQLEERLKKLKEIKKLEEKLEKLFNSILEKEENLN